MKVKDCMCNHVNFVKPETIIRDCANMMCECHIGCTLVCAATHKLVGIVFDSDIILRAVACDKDTCKTPVSEIMTTKPYTCDCNSDVSEAEKIMAKNQVRRIPVLENNKVIGMLTLGDLAANEAIDEDHLCDTIECICGTNEKNAE